MQQTDFRGVRRTSSQSSGCAGQFVAYWAKGSMGTRELEAAAETKGEADARVRVRGNRLADSQDRTLMLRGVNLGGNSKIPTGVDALTQYRGSFFDHKNVSFVGRPFPLDEADEHFRRLHAWGFTFLRFLVTWEAIEHAGPGNYDDEYLAYLRAVVSKAGEHGFSVLIDFHQDVWSRWTGGDGAPGWTLEAAGFNIQNIARTYAAILHDISDRTRPHMTWFANATKLATATMFTLFFGGNDFAASTRIGDRSAQEYLQEHYINAALQVVSHLADLPCVIGYEPINEPSRGYIGWENITLPKIVYDHGITPSPIQSMLLGMGHSQNVGVWKRSLWGTRQSGVMTLNTEAVRAWREDFNCIWRQNGVWDLDVHGRPQILRHHHFTEVNGAKIDFSGDYLLPFVKRFDKAIRSVSPGAILFIEGEPTAEIFGLFKGELPNAVYAPHWYDAISLIKKKYLGFIGVDNSRRKLVLGAKRGRRSFAEQLKRFSAISEARLDGRPVIIGEIGVPFDLHGGKAYRTGDFTRQIMAIDRSLAAAEGALLGYALWNYNPDNDNRHGDHWNGEDLSIFSRDQRSDGSDINSGGRALEAIVRPYPIATAGMPVHLSFDYEEGIFTYTFRHEPGSEASTEIFVPSYQYPEDYVVDISDGSFEKDPDGQRLYYRHGTGKTDHTLRISRPRR